MVVDGTEPAFVGGSTKASIRIYSCLATFMWPDVRFTYFTPLQILALLLNEQQTNSRPCL